MPRSPNSSGRVRRIMHVLLWCAWNLGLMSYDIDVQGVIALPFSIERPSVTFTVFNCSLQVSPSSGKL